MTPALRPRRSLLFAPGNRAEDSGAFPPTPGGPGVLDGNVVVRAMVRAPRHLLALRASMAPAA
jgi:hypothetical protein